MKSVIRTVFFVAGLLALLLAILGIALPLLPTVPFLLLAAWCFAKSSPRFEAWLLAHPRLGPPIIAWRTRRAVPLRAKQLAWGGMAISSLISACVLPLPLGLLPALLCTGVGIFLWRLPTA